MKWKYSETVQFMFIIYCTKNPCYNITHTEIYLFFFLTVSNFCFTFFSLSVSFEYKKNHFENGKIQLNDMIAARIFKTKNINIIFSLPRTAHIHTHTKNHKWKNEMYRPAIFMPWENCHYFFLSLFLLPAMLCCFLLLKCRQVEEGAWWWNKKGLCIQKI